MAIAVVLGALIAQSARAEGDFDLESDDMGYGHVDAEFLFDDEVDYFEDAPSYYGASAAFALPQVSVPMPIAPSPTFDAIDRVSESVAVTETAILAELWYPDAVASNETIRTTAPFFDPAPSLVDSSIAAGEPAADRSRASSAELTQEPTRGGPGKAPSGPASYAGNERAADTAFASSPSAALPATVVPSPMLSTPVLLSAVRGAGQADVMAGDAVGAGLEPARGVREPLAGGREPVTIESPASLDLGFMLDRPRSLVDWVTGIGKNPGPVASFTDQGPKVRYSVLSADGVSFAAPVPVSVSFGISDERFVPRRRATEKVACQISALRPRAQPLSPDCAKPGVVPRLRGLARRAPAGTGAASAMKDTTHEAPASRPSGSPVAVARLLPAASGTGGSLSKDFFMTMGDEGGPLPAARAIGALRPASGATVATAEKSASSARAAVPPSKPGTGKLPAPSLVSSSKAAGASGLRARVGQLRAGVGATSTRLAKATRRIAMRLTGASGVELDEGTADGGGALVPGSGETRFQQPILAGAVLFAERLFGGDSAARDPDRAVGESGGWSAWLRSIPGAEASRARLAALAALLGAVFVTWIGRRARIARRHRS